MPRRVLVSGISGRMGLALVRAVRGDVRFTLVGGTVRPGSELVGQDAGVLFATAPLGAPLFDDVKAAFAKARPEVVIDFSHPDATRECADICAQRGAAL